MTELTLISLEFRKIDIRIDFEEKYLKQINKEAGTNPEKIYF